MQMRVLLLVSSIVDCVSEAVAGKLLSQEIPARQNETIAINISWT